MMDTRRFAAAIGELTAGLPRRAMLGLGAGTLLAAIGVADADTKKRKRKKKKKCKAKPAAQVCAGKCGATKNNCKKTVVCGNCPDGQCCDGAGSCGPCLVFVTSTQHWGDFGGLSGADAVCQDLAEAAGLPGDYLAWLADTTGSPSTRFVRATVPYIMVDGTVIANNWTDLTDGQIANAILLDELGLEAQGFTRQPWTNVKADGTAGGVEEDAHCNNWTSSLGGPGGHVGNNGFALSSVTDEGWTAFRIWDCPMPWELYCFQQR